MFNEKAERINGWAAMIGIVGYLKYNCGLFSNYNTIASPRLAYK